MDNKLARLFSDFDRGSITRRRLLQLLSGAAAAGAPFATSLFGQGGCRDGYGQGRCQLTKELATAPIKPVFAPTGWKTVALEHITFQVADYKKEAAFYTALMGWKLRSDDGNQATMDIGEWGSCIFKKAPPGTMPDAAPAAAPTAAGALGGRGGGGEEPARAVMQSFGFVIDQ